MHPSLLTDIVTTLRAMESPEAGEWLALTRTPDALTREGAPGHFTASALPISPDARQVCLVLHRRMDLWVQPGGHLEFGDTSIAGAAAREMEEETGLQGRVDPRPVLLSRHPAPCRPETWHYDIQFRAVVPVTRPVLSDESNDVAWFPIDRLPQDIADGVDGLVEAAVSRSALPGSR